MNENNKDSIKFQYISDLHLEFTENREFLRRNPIKPVGEVLLIAGDFAYSVRNNESKWSYDIYADKFLDYFSKNWTYTIIVPGNHEYYGANDSIYLNESQYIKAQIRSNVFVLNNLIIDLIKENNKIRIATWNDRLNPSIEDKMVRILGTTLWSFIPYESHISIKRGMNDYNYCFYEENETLSIGRTIELHYSALNFLKSGLCSSLSGKKNIIVTHHLPSFKCISKGYQNNQLNNAYASDLNNFIKTMKPTAWVFGHSHNIGKWKIGDTKLYEASLGYVFDNNEQKLKKCLNKTFTV